MANGLALTAGVLAAGLTGCFGGAAAFTCDTGRTDQCNAKGPGTCEPNGFCSYSDQGCPQGQRYGENSGGLSNICVGEEPPPDGGMDADNRVCFGAGMVKPCFPTAPTGDLTLPSAIDTTDSPLCSTDVMDVPAGLCVIARANITVPAGTTVAVTGDRPLVLVATGTISITGVLDAASRHATTDPFATTQIGAGADPTGGCNVGVAPAVSGGGAGGTFVIRGGNGGNGNGGAVGGMSGIAQTIALRGGCRGQEGTGTSLIPAQGGRGGGALYLIANTITISGVINASGEGGHRGVTGGNNSGAGGGAGGLIGLDAPTIDNTGTVFANGGGGGEGSGGGASGLPGLDPTGITAASGGTGGGGGNGGVGGAGGTGGGNALGGPGQNAPNDGGGGGGGGTGVIKVYRGTIGGDHSPMPTP
jgi:hypothetical protein